MGKNLLYYGAFVILYVCFNVSADTTIVNASLGVSAYLPDNWTAITENDTTLILYDTTFTCRSHIACKRYIINSSDYLSPTSWTRAHFIAYLMVVQYSYDPFGAVLYFDSSSTSRQGSFWSPEAFSEFYTIDTFPGAWDEFIRFTETGPYGYEIYAIGDTADMKKNIITYMAIIRMIGIIGQDNVKNISSGGIKFIRQSEPFTNYEYDLLGKRINGRSSITCSGIYCRPATKRVGMMLR